MNDAGYNDRMRQPFSLLYVLLIIFGLGFILAFIQVGLITIAFDKLGLTATQAMLLLFSSLFGSAINLPVTSIRAEPLPEDMPVPPLRSILRLPPVPFTGKTLIAVNVGGCIIPLVFSLNLLRNNPISLLEAGIAIAIITAISYAASRPVPGIGIGIPALLAPLSAAIVASIVDAEHAAPLAYICGTLGVLIGADVLRLKDIRALGAPMASIGGAGTFDGIFITGIVAVLLA